MIARFRILLTRCLSIPVGTTLSPFDLLIDGKTVRVYPPMKAGLSIGDLLLPNISMTELTNRLNPIALEPTSQLLINKAPTIETNMLQLETSAVEFDRRIGIADANPDNEVHLFFQAANHFIARLRTVTRTSELKPISEHQTIWTIRYLNDDQSELEQQDGLCRGRFSGNFRFSAVGLDAETWRIAKSLPEQLVLRTWEALILDALAALPEAGPAIVLSATALETSVSYALDILQSRLQPPLPVELWEWINDRGDFRKEPSMEERFDILFKITSGKSLKNEPLLWDAFKQIKNARNNFVHEGRASAGGTTIDSTQAARLVNKAEEIIAWGEQLLPAEFRRNQLPEREYMFALPDR